MTPISALFHKGFSTLKLLKLTLKSKCEAGALSALGLASPRCRITVPCYGAVLKAGLSFERCRSSATAPGAFASQCRCCAGAGQRYTCHCHRGRPVASHDCTLICLEYG